MTDETTNPNRWTAKVHMQAGTNGTGYAVWLYERDEYHGNIYLGTQADCRKLAEQINRPAHATNDQIVAACGANDYWWRNHSTGRYYAGPTLSGDGSINWPDPAPTAPADDLPPGVERISDGTLWIRLDPDRTEKVLPDDYEWLSDTAVEMDEPVMVQVRPITPAEPATEWVPWWEAVGRTLDCPRRKVTEVGADGTGPWVWLESEGRTRVPISADGMVEVQR